MSAKIFLRITTATLLLSLLSSVFFTTSPLLGEYPIANELTSFVTSAFLSETKDYMPTVSTSAVDYSGLPNVDEILYKAYPDATPDIIVSEFLAGVTDWIDGPYRKDFYDLVVAAGEKVSPMDPVPEFSFGAIWCQDYDQTSGEANMPLNDSAFRLALTYIYGVNDKQTDILAYVGVPWTFAIGNPVPPAQEPWYNESIQMPETDWDKAWTDLQAAGYYIGVDDCLYRGATKLRNMTVYYSTGSLYWEQGPGVGFVRNFNAFISYIGAVGPVMSLVPVSFGTLVSQLLLYHDYDFIFIGLESLGRYVDWLYDCLHSDNIVPWGWNFCGISDPDFDTWTEAILTDPDVDNVIGNASLVQDKFVNELMPWFPISSGMAFCTTAGDVRGELVNVVSMPNFGPMNDWSFMTAHWKDSTGGTIKVALAGSVSTLNPYSLSTSYHGWQILDRAVTGLLSVDPNTLQNMPFVATDWTATTHVSIPELGIVDGSMITFYLRQDVYWHDGKPVTAYDCVNNLRLVKKYKEHYCNDMLVYGEAEGPYKFNAYLYTSNPYYVDYVASVALLSPKHVTDAAEAMYGSIKPAYWDPAFNSYKDLMGVDPPLEYPFMKQIVGCGPFVYDYFDGSSQTGRVVKYDEFFVNAPVIGAVVGEWRVDPSATYSYKVLVQNMGAENNTEEGEFVPVTVDVKIYEDGALEHTLAGLTLPLWNTTYLGQYTTGSLSGGYHHVTVEVYESGNLVHTYEHEYYAVPREDVSTCSGDLRDCFVDVKDILRAALAYASYPGSSKWDAACDVWPASLRDFFVDIKDLLAIALKYGWHGTPKPP